MHDDFYQINTLKHKIVNWLHSLMLLAGMALLLGLLGWIFAGPVGIRWATIITIVSLVISPHLSPRIILRWYAAKPISYQEAPALYSVLRELSQRAKLQNTPTLYYVPTKILNAFTTGSRSNAAIAITDGLLNTLSMWELASVIAHEVGHLKNNDLWIMNLSDTISRVTSFFSMSAQLLVFMNLPLLLTSGHHISWTGILVLIFAPTITVLLQMALSRTREFDADLDAAMLTGDPEGLASALAKMERYQGGWMARIFFPGHREPQPSILRTHPQTQERIKRLLDLSPGRHLHQRLLHPYEDGAFAFSAPSVRIRRQPRWRFGGIWY
ncbi:MAG: peptidase M48 [Deltaproteobacteria bacterium]|nr:MAG: peptidase M48 [Deltaproteobacteria bacterium]